MISSSGKSVIAKGGHEILIVDDMDELRMFTALMLRKRGYDVFEANNGYVALEKLRERKPDIVLLDLEMPVMSGFETLKRIRKQKDTEELPVIIFTSSLNVDHIDLLVREADDFISKPANPVEIAAKVKKILNGEKTIKYAGKPVLLIVAMNEDIRNFLSQKINLIGYNTISSRNGFEAVFIAKKFKVDLVISATDMQDMNGFRYPEFVKKVLPETPLLVVVNDCEDTESSYRVDGVLDISFTEADINRYLNISRQEVEPESDIEIKKGSEQKSILLADDSEFNQFIVKSLLKNEPYELDIVDNGKQVLTKIRNKEFDLILMDIQMPEMNGIEAAKILRTKGYDVPIVALTSNVEEAISAGMNDYIEKPLRKDLLREKLEKHLGFSKDRAEKNGQVIVDMDKLIEVFEGDKQLLKDMFEIFLSKYPQRMQELSEVVCEKDAERLSSAAHSFKGVVDYFKVARITTLTSRLEMMGRKNKMQGAEGVFNELSKLLENFVKSMKEKI